MCVLVQENYKPGDLPPENYLAWHEWAEVQYKAGIKQVECGICGRWKTPQELSDKFHTTKAICPRKGEIEIIDPICLKCVTKITYY